MFTGLTAEEKATRDNGPDGSALGSRLTCGCAAMEGLIPVHWLDNNGSVLPEDDRNKELVDYRVTNKQPGTAVHLRINDDGFSCADAGSYTCVVGNNTRSVLVTPIGECSG